MGVSQALVALNLGAAEHSQREAVAGLCSDDDHLVLVAVEDAIRYLEMARRAVRGW